MTEFRPRVTIWSSFCVSPNSSLILCSNWDCLSAVVIGVYVVKNERNDCVRVRGNQFCGSTTFLSSQTGLPTSYVPRTHSTTVVWSSEVRLGGHTYRDRA